MRGELPCRKCRPSRRNSAATRALGPTRISSSRSKFPNARTSISRAVTATSNRIRRTRAINRIDDNATKEVEHGALWRARLLPAGSKAPGEGGTQSRGADTGLADKRTAIEGFGWRRRARQTSFERHPSQELMLQGCSRASAEP